MISVWLASIWAASIRGGAALLVAWLFCKIPQVPANVRCWAWRAAYLVLPISFFWTTPLNMPLLRPVVGSQRQIQTNLNPDRSLIPVAEVSDSGATAPVVVSRATTAPPQPPWPMVAFCIWLLIVAASAAYLMTSWLKARGFRNGPLIDLPDLADLCRAMNIRRPPVVRTHANLPGPLLIGLRSPTIILPESMARSNHLRLIIAHELAHLQRLDLLWNWLPTLATAVLPLHPLVWICNRQWRLATEAACDAVTLSATAAPPAEYGRVLFTIATTPISHSRVLAVAVAAESRWLLKRRLTAMGNITHWNGRRLAIAKLMAVVLTIVAAIPWRVVAQQPAPVVPSPGPAAAPQAPKAAEPSTTPVSGDAVPPGAPSQPGDVATWGSILVPTANIRSLSSGTVEKVNYTSGQAVKKGDVLVELDSDARANAVESAEQILKTNIERQTRVEESAKAGLATDLDASTAKVNVALSKDTLLQRQLELQQTKITAPFDGVITEIKTSVGSTVLPGDPIADVFDPTKPAVKFLLPPSQAQLLKPGNPIKVVDPNDQIIGQGEITSVSPTMDVATGNVQVLAKITITKLTLTPNESVLVIILSNK